jgi:hypothetical protein
LLRIGVIIIGSVMLLCAALGANAGWPLKAVIPLGLWGAILAGGLLVERWRYQRPADGRPGHEWKATSERFVDPESGQLVTVFFNPATGERRYVADKQQRRTGQPM